MFRLGKPRTFKHNLRLAAMLSMVAGIVNVTGVLAISTLTTNVTGHFAYFAEEIARAEYSVAATFFSYILSFLSGAFLCGVLVEWSVGRKSPRSHTLPLIMEILLLLAVALLFGYSAASPAWVARLLLFAMGLQNALVTQVSKATVRTTHLTGLFTDLGIELSQLIFYRDIDDSRRLSRSINLRMAIISSFFVGGIIGGFIFNVIGIFALSIAVALLAVALIYDNVRVGLSYYSRKFRTR